MQEVIAWAKLNSALKECLVRVAAHCLSSHSLESTIFYGWWGTDGSQCCPRTLQWWGWKQCRKKYIKKMPLSWWLLLWLHSNYTCMAYTETDIFGQSEHWNRSFGSILSLFIYSFFSCFTVELHRKPSGVMDFSSKLTFQQPGSHQLPQFRFNILAGGILNPKISLGESKYSFISCPFIDWHTTGVCPHTLWLVLFNNTFRSSRSDRCVLFCPTRVMTSLSVVQLRMMFLMFMRNLFQEKLPPLRKDVPTISLVLCITRPLKLSKDSNQSWTDTGSPAHALVLHDDQEVCVNTLLKVSCKFQFASFYATFAHFLFKITHIRRP